MKRLIERDVDTRLMLMLELINEDVEDKVGGDGVWLWLWLMIEYLLKIGWICM